MKKILLPCKAKTWDNKYWPVFIKVETERGYLSFSGVHGPLKSGNAKGGAGQIDMEFKHRNPNHDDNRTSQFLSPLLTFNWSRKKWYDLLEYWHDWHLKPIDEVPENVIEFLESLPESKIKPNWI